MMSTAKYRKFLREFIRLYSQLPAVWKVKSKEYSDRQKKSDAYDILVAKYKELDEHADRETVRKKINALRTNFRRELSKIRSLQACDNEKEYVPSLWYFKDLEFLTEQEESGEGLQLQLRPEDNCSETTFTDKSPAPEVLLSVSDNSNAKQKTIKLKQRKPMKKTFRKRKFSKPKKINELIDLASSYLQQQEDDEAAIFAKIWAIEYRKLKPEQQLYAKKAIDDILFEARLGRLRRDSVQVYRPISLTIPDTSNFSDLQFPRTTTKGRDDAQNN